MHSLISFLLFSVLLVNVTGFAIDNEQELEIKYSNKQANDVIEKDNVNIQPSLSIKRLAIQAEQQLIKLSPVCYENQLSRIEDAKRTAYKSFFKCNYSAVFGNATALVKDSIEFAATVTADTTAIVAEFTVCGASAGPIQMIYCIIKSLKDLPYQVYDIYQASKAYKDVLYDVLPKLYRAASDCLHKSSTNYQLFLEGIVSQAKMCENLNRKM